MPIALTDSIREEIVDFLNQNLTILGDGVYSHYYDEGYEDEDWFDDFCYEQGADSQEHGCTKMVLFYRELPHWVVKIPFRGEYNEDEDNFNDFCGAGDYYPIDKDNDYCAGEVYISQKAEEYGLGDMFAKTYYLMDYNGTPIYIAEKVVNSYWVMPDWHDRMTSKALAEDVSACCSNVVENSSIREEVIARFIDIYGEERTYELMSFIEEYHITDLHCGNVGFTKDMKIKILDYAGFNN